MPSINKGWYEPSDTVVGDWVIRKEVQQLPETACSSSTDSSDCYQWRIYAQEFGSAKHKLLARSDHPGFQSLAPQLSSDGAILAWEESTNAGRYLVFVWKPSYASPKRIDVRRKLGSVQANNGDLFLTEPARLATGEVYKHVIIEEGLNSRKSKIIATYMGASNAEINNDEFLYFAANGVTRARWRCQKFGHKHSFPVGKKLLSPYSITWLGNDRFLSWSDSGYQVESTSSSTISTVAGPDAPLSVPANGGAGLSIGVIEARSYVSLGQS